ncbi:aminopeptidase P family protein [Desulfonatronospira sp.]|uniref:M24 family metallopeptidase n=1 Tax=Desulfonatronospira sp. TaxID=1962951 RepID=UPI0025BCDEE9|nr:aminopeptidase P family protein [Desulfonatronospira sp.]
MQESRALRRQKLKMNMAEKEVEAIIITSPANRYYLSGFELHDPQCNESAGYLLITPDRDYLLTDPRYLEEGKEFFSDEDIFIYTRDKFKQIQGYLKKIGVVMLGFEPQWMNYEYYTALSQEFEMVPVKGLVEDLRFLKDARELELLRKSCSLNHKVFARIEEMLCPGLLEKDIAWEAEKLFREEGASELGFSTIVAAGERSALPHASPGSKVLEKGMPLLVDMGCRYQDYCSDQSRTFWVGPGEDVFFRQTRDLVRQAQDLVIEWIAPGKPISEAYKRVKTYFAEHGVDGYFTHSLGHGIGLETHEAPSLGPDTKGEFVPGMVVTVEPGLYYAGWGGVRWEYMVLITDNGVEIL